MHDKGVGIKSFSITRLKLLSVYFASTSSAVVGIKSFSITRLKHRWNNPRPCLNSCWNQKFLDYEIETVTFAWRLSHSWVCRWNQKFLDYEIETWHSRTKPLPNVRRWNQKFLDYEIETKAAVADGFPEFELESKVSRLRDWNSVKNTADTESAILIVGIKSFSITRLKTYAISGWVDRQKRVC